MLVIFDILQCRKLHRIAGVYETGPGEARRFGLHTVGKVDQGVFDFLDAVELRLLRPAHELLQNPVQQDHRVLLGMIRARGVVAEIEDVVEIVAASVENLQVFTKKLDLLDRFRVLLGKLDPGHLGFILRLDRHLDVADNLLAVGSRTVAENQVRKGVTVFVRFDGGVVQNGLLNKGVKICHLHI